MKRFSIIIPTFQEEQYIGACLSAIERQSIGREAFEVIVSDASSSDDTVAIARNRADITIVTHERGIARGRNAGAYAADGEILVFVDADAELDETFLTVLDGVFRDPSVVGCTGIADPADGTAFARLVYIGTYILVRIFHWFGLPLFPGICAAYRAEAFRNAGGFRENLGVSEDLDLSRRIRRTGRCRIAGRARARVSTRRLAHHALSVVLFHIANDVRYLLTGTSAKHYPKTEETRRWYDLWKSRNNGVG